MGRKDFGTIPKILLPWMTAAQLKTVNTFYGGVKNAKGELIFSGQALGNPIPALRGTNQAPYSMSKYAALSLSEALAHELEGTKIGVSVLCPGPINTNIARGARNRPEHMGGPQSRPSDEAVLAERLATQGLDPKRVGERVVDAIRTNTFYAFVGAVPADVIRARHRHIEDALNSPWVTHY